MRVVHLFEASISNLVGQTNASRVECVALACLFSLACYVRVWLLLLHRNP